MKKAQVDQYLKYHNGAAMYVVAHAKRQKSRGKNPSVSYKNVRNPEKALEMAVEELKTYKTRIGDCLVPVVHLIKKTARLIDDKVTTIFNEIELEVMPDIDPESVIAYFHNQTNKRSEEWEKSPERQQFLKEMEEKKIIAQTQIDLLMYQLENYIDFNDPANIIEWFCAFRPGSDLAGVHTPWEKILSVFAEKEYYPNMNSKEEFDADSEEIFAKWLIGQALACLECEVHAIHPIFQKFVKDWRQKFSIAA